MEVTPQLVPGFVGFFVDALPLRSNVNIDILQHM